MAFNVSAVSGNFTITDPATVTLSSPNSGTLNVNDNLSISWTKSGFSENVDLYYTSNSTFSTSNAIATNVSGSSYTWDVPSGLSNSSQYIWVRKTGDSSVKDSSTSAITFYISNAFTPADTTAFSESVSFDSSDVWRFVKTATDTTTFSTDSVTTAESLWKHVKTAADTTSFSESVSKFVFKQPRPSDTTTFSTDSVSAVESKWKHIFAVSDTTSFATDSVTTVESEWKHRKLPTDTTTFSADAVETKVFRQPRPEDTMAFTESVLTALSLWRAVYPIEETTEFTEDVSVEFGNGCRMLKLDAGSDNESLGVSRKSGWVSLGSLDKNTIIRRLNMRYKSSDPVTVKVFANEDTSNPIFNHAFAATSDVINKKIRVGKRAKYVMMELSTGSTTNYDMAIDHLEVEVDGS